MVGPLLFLLFANHIPSVINVTKLLFADDVKMVSPSSQSGLLRSSTYNFWNFSVNWDLPINPPNAVTCYWTGSSTSTIPCNWKPWQFRTTRKRCYGRSHGQLFITLQSLQRGCLQSKTDDVYDKAVVRSVTRVHCERLMWPGLGGHPLKCCRVLIGAFEESLPFQHES